MLKQQIMIISEGGRKGGREREKKNHTYIFTIYSYKIVYTVSLLRYRCFNPKKNKDSCNKGALLTTKNTSCQDSIQVTSQRYNEKPHPSMHLEVGIPIRAHHAFCCLSITKLLRKMATSDVRDILDIGAGDQGRTGQLADAAAKPTKESIMNPFKVSHKN